MASSGAGSHELSRNETSVVIFLAILIGFGLLAGAVFVGTVRVEAGRAPLVLSLQLVFGVVVLITTLAAYGLLLHGVGVSDGKRALALPEGSVRAVLALALLLVFAIVAVFVYGELNNPHGVQSTGLTTEQIALIPAARILEIHPTGSAQPGQFDVTLSTSDPAATQVAQQLVTVLATLVTAVAAFYFGAASVNEASRAARAPQPAPQPEGQPAPQPEGQPAPGG